MLQIKNLSKCFEDLEVLRDVNMTVSKGEVVVIIGPSGSGKSTFLRCINLLEKPTGGEILYLGDNIVHLGKKVTDYRKQVGMVFQRFHLFPLMSTLENVMYAPMKLNKVPQKEAREEALKLLEKVGLSHKADSYPCCLLA